MTTYTIQLSTADEDHPRPTGQIVGIVIEDLPYERPDGITLPNTPLFCFAHRINPIDGYETWYAMDPFSPDWQSSHESFEKAIHAQLYHMYQTHDLMEEGDEFVVDWRGQSYHFGTRGAQLYRIEEGDP